MDYASFAMILAYDTFIIIASEAFVFIAFFHYGWDMLFSFWR
jgi:hypothetical protein